MQDFILPQDILNLTESYAIGTPYSKLLQSWYSQTINIPKITECKDCVIDYKKYLRSFDINNLEYVDTKTYTVAYNMPGARYYDFSNIPRQENVGVERYIIREGTPLFYANTIHYYVPENISLYFYPRAAEISLYNKALVKQRLYAEDFTEEEQDYIDFSPPAEYTSASKEYYWLPTYISLYRAKTDFYILYEQQPQYIADIEKLYGKIDIAGYLKNINIIGPVGDDTIDNVSIDDILSMNIDEYVNYINLEHSIKHVNNAYSIPNVTIYDINKYLTLDDTYLIDTESLVANWLDYEKQYVRAIREKQNTDLVMDDFYIDPVLKVE